MYLTEQTMKHAFDRSHLFLICCLLVLASDIRGQTSTVSGTIRDSQTGTALIAATIRVAGSARGTISNAQGDYRLALPDGEYTLLFSYVGYRTDTVHIQLLGNLKKDVNLEPSPVQLAEVVVTGEDPALAIMRKVIENKKKWAEKLKSYQLEAFTRQIIRRDTAIAVISESYSTCYWQRGDTLREVIRQKRQTENISGTQNFAGVGGILNFYDDEIRLAGFRFVGPTAPSAFDYYDFKLERTKRRTGSDIYDIRMLPKTRLIPLFHGTISIAEGSYAVAGISVTPNEAFVIPFVSELRLSYAQQYSIFENEYWMPVDIRINGFFQVGITGLKLPGIGIEAISSIYDCKINPAIPDSIFKKPRRVVQKEADQYDSTFWRQRDVLPLTQEEKTAYQKLDSTQTLEKQFQPSGPLVTMANLMEAAPVSPQVRFNRVEGLFLGVSSHLDSATNRLKTNASAGYAFSDKRAKGNLGAEIFMDRQRDYSFRLEVYQEVNHFPDGGAHDNLSNLFSTLLYKIDYFDYYYTKGFDLSFAANLTRGISVELGYRNEDQTTATKRTNYSLFARDRTYDSNPPIEEGVLREIWLTTRYGQEPAPIPIIPRNYVQVDINHTTPEIRSSFDYTKVSLQGEYHFATFLRSLFLPPSLMIKLSSGMSLGALPPQRYYHFDAPLLGYAPSGILRGARMHEFSGDTYFIATFEHNFRSVPFLWLDIPFLYKNSIELLIFANVAQSWKYASSAPSNIHPTNGLYRELGCGISRIFGLFRIDYTYRLSSPQRSIVTMGVAMLF
jgi:hypothetical protein